MDLASAERLEAGARGEHGGDDVGAGAAEMAARAREEGESEVRARPREGGDEDGVGVEGGAGKVGAEGAERVGQAARGGVEGDELREEDRVRVRAHAGRDEEAGVELRGVSGVELEARAAQCGEEGRQLADAAASRAHAGGLGGGAVSVRYSGVPLLLVSRYRTVRASL